MTHDELVKRAVRWLTNQNCGVVFHDGMKAHTANGEEPDAIGWRSGSLSILIECKATRSDFLSDRRKTFRKFPQLGMGDWRFYMCPPGLIDPSEVPEGWGLLYAEKKRTRKILGVPGNVGWNRQAPFEGNKRCEMEVMYSALRRITLRGYLYLIYQPLSRFR